MDFCGSGVKDKSYKLKPGEQMLYTWDNPLAKREIVWNAGDKTKHQPNALLKVRA